MSKKILGGIIAVLLIIIVILIFSLAKGSGQTNQTGTTNGQANNASDSNGSLTPKTDQIGGLGGQQITINGWIFCLPHVNASSTDCVIGIEDANNDYYGLVDQSGTRPDPAQFTTGTRQTISGVLVADPVLQKDYNVKGVIQVTQ